MNNQECNSAKQVALSRLNALSSNADFFVSDEATVRTLREFMSLTSAAMTELSDQIQSNELAAEKRHEEILAASKSSDRLNWPNFICAAIAALGVLVPATFWFISHFLL